MWGVLMVYDIYIVKYMRESNSVCYLWAALKRRNKRGNADNTIVIVDFLFLRPWLIPSSGVAGIAD